MSLSVVEPGAGVLDSCCAGDGRVECSAEWHAASCVSCVWQPAGRSVVQLPNPNGLCCSYLASEGHADIRALLYHLISDMFGDYQKPLK